MQGRGKGGVFSFVLKRMSFQTKHKHPSSSLKTPIVPNVHTTLKVSGEETDRTF